MAKRDLVISTRKSDFDGYVNIVFEDEESKQVSRVENVDVWKELRQINDTIDPDESDGTPFFLALRRYISAAYGVQVSIWAAQEYYDALVGLMKDTEESFTKVLDSSASTESSRSDGPSEKSESTTTSSQESEPKN